MFCFWAVILFEIISIGLLINFLSTILSKFFDRLKKIAKKVDSSLLKDINLFDVFSGDKLPKNKKSYALSFIFEDNTKTLTDFQIDKIMGKLISEYQNSVGAEIR